MMSDSPGNNPDHGSRPEQEPLDVPVEQSPMEIEPVRRAASAQFTVDAEVGSAAALREAMDPANRSLADALQMSFRVLQLVIIVLLVLFVFSGFKTVGASQSGVATVWGRIVDRKGLDPGLQMNWPPPIGEFVLFQSDGRVVDDQGVFFPRRLVDMGLEGAMERSSSRDRLMPGEDGSFLTSNGEMGHVRVAAEYRVVDPVLFLQNVPDPMGDSIVRVALERAIVRVGGSDTLQSLQDISNEEVQEMVQDSAQGVLDEVGSGLRITSVSLLNEIQPPIFIQKIQENYIQSLQSSQARIERAKKDAQEILIEAAGEKWPELDKRIREYEKLWDINAEGLEDRLADINTFLDSEDLAGEAAGIIISARRFQSGIDRTLGAEAQRFKGLLETYRSHPELVIAEKWLEVYGKIMERPDAELMYVPRGIGGMGIDIAGLESVRDIRRRADLRARELATGILSGDSADYMLRADEIRIDQAQRQLSIDESGQVVGMREELLNKDN
ncbi:MAG: hypothetical protein MK089_03310 [Phycisphaerales bacterium]|nr:hypothetical protein [Phycisphaerales bacterium]